MDATEIQENKRRTMRSAASVPNLNADTSNTFGRKKMSAPNGGTSQAKIETAWAAFSQPDLVGTGEVNTRDSM